MEEKLYIRRLGDTRNVSRYNVILMNPTPLELIMLVSEYENALKDINKKSILVNPGVIKTIYSKLFDDSRGFDHSFAFATTDIDELQWYYDYKITDHDSAGGSESEFLVRWFNNNPKPQDISGDHVILVEHYRGKDNTIYTLRCNFTRIGFTGLPVLNEPILSQTNLMKNKFYRLFVCGVLVFLQVYGWIEVPRFQKHELGVI